MSVTKHYEMYIKEKHVINAQSSDSLKYSTPKLKKKNVLFNLLFRKELPCGYVALCFHKTIFPRATEFLIP